MSARSHASKIYKGESRSQNVYKDIKTQRQRQVELSLVECLCGNSTMGQPDAAPSLIMSEAAQCRNPEAAPGRNADTHVYIDMHRHAPPQRYKDTDSSW